MISLAQKRFYPFCILFLLSVAYCCGQNLHVMTYNIKYDNPNDTLNNWHDRKLDMIQLVKHYHPGIVGMQEVLHGQLHFLKNSLKNFKSIGVAREDGKTKGEYAPILYDSTTFKPLKSNTFWLSKTPHKISVGWDAALERICTYGLFEVLKTNQKFWVFNTHLDHKGVVAREKSVQLILSKIASLNKEHYPVILMGDFNLNPSEKAIQHLTRTLTDAKEVSLRKFYGPSGTFNGFDVEKVLNERIDYIFVDQCTVHSYQHIDDRKENNKYISDHLPVYCELSLKN